jgi:toxin ParE1/3/4
MGPRHRAVVWTTSAEEALDEGIGFIARDSPAAAEKVLERALAAAASLSSLPNRGAPVPETEDPTIRQILSDPYRLIYRVEDERVLILAVLHQRQDVERWALGR